MDEQRGGAAGGAAGRVADFFIAGHEKCGTTALYRILGQHPQLFLPELKEPRFFVAPRPESGGAELAPDGRPLTLRSYRQLFAPATDAQLAGDGSPQYLRSPEAAGLIAAAQPAARIIAILREPVSFIRSFHMNNVRSLIEDERDLLRAIELEPERREGRRIPKGVTAPIRLQYTEHLRYVDQLRRFESVLPPEQIKVLIYDDFRRDNQAAAGEVLRFLGVDDSFSFERVEVRRERPAVRMRRGHRLALALQRARRGSRQAGPAARIVDALTPAALRSQRVDDLARRLIFARAPELSAGQVAELRRRFAPEVAALSEHLGRDLVSEWGYDRID